MQRHKFLGAALTEGKPTSTKILNKEKTRKIRAHLVHFEVTINTTSYSKKVY